MTDQTMIFTQTRKKFVPPPSPASRWGVMLTLVSMLVLCSWTRTASAQTYQLTDLGAGQLTGLQTGGGFGDAINENGQVAGSVSITDNSGPPNFTITTSEYAFRYSDGTLTNLGTLGGQYSASDAINASGQVTGSASTANNASSDAFISNGATMTDLGTLGGTSSEGAAINASGQVTGDASTAGNAAQHAFLYSSGKMTDLGTLGGTNSYGVAINASGQVAGYADNQVGGNTFHAFISNGTNLTDLGTLGGTSSMASAINASGQVAGWANTASADQHAFLYSSGKMTDLGTLGSGTSSYGLAINASGQVTGYSYIQGGTGNTHAFISNGTTMIDLGSLSSLDLGLHGSPEIEEIEGLAINASGEVTGYEEADGIQHGFLYAGGEMIDLNSLLSPDASALYTITSGVGINDKGQIVADGQVDSTHADEVFLFSPISTVPLPAAAWLMLSGLGGFAGFVRLSRRVVW